MKTKTRSGITGSKYFVPAFALVLLSGAVFAFVLTQQIDVTVNVQEALLITTPTSLTLDLMPNETSSSFPIDVYNNASVSNTAQLSWVVDSNPAGVTYDVAFDSAPTEVVSHSTFSTSAVFHIHSDSPVGTLAGHFAVTRS